MARTRKYNPTTQIAQDVKLLRKQSRELLKKANKNVREYRKELSILKKQGAVSKRVDIRKQRATKYMLSKIRKFGDVIRGEANLVRPSKEIREKYVEKGLFEARGPFLVIPKDEAMERAGIRKDMVTKYYKLKNGEFRKIVLPYKATDMEEFVEQIRNNADMINKMKEPTEQFAFQLWGNNALAGSPNAEQLADYIINHYQHLFRGPNRRTAMKNFVLIRFKSNQGYMDIEPIQGERLTHIRKRPMNEKQLEKRRARNREYMKRARENETPEQKLKRNEKNKIRMRQLRQRRFEEK